MMGHPKRLLMSPLEKLDPRSKLLFVVSISILSVSLDNTVSLSILAVLSAIFFALSFPSFPRIKMVFFLILLTTWGVVISQGMFYNRYPRTILFTIIPPFELLGHNFYGLHIYIQGLYYGLVQSLRFISCALSGIALCFSTSPDRMFLGLMGLRIPRTLSFLSIMAIRFIPEFMDEFSQVRQAMRIKGYKPFKRGIIYTVKSELKSLYPVFASAIRRSEEISESLIVRGFNPLDEKISRRERWKRAEMLPSFFFLLLSFFILLVKITFYLYERGILYEGFLRPLYHVARNIL